MTRVGELTISTPGDCDIVMTRVFDAPRHLVFEALSKPELLKQWMLGPGWSMVVCEVDLRPGGSYRYVWRKSGLEMAMHGTFREIVPDRRIVSEESFDTGCESQSGRQVATLVLDELEGRTTLTQTVVYPSRAARDATIASGMDGGLSASYDRLSDLLGT